MASNDFELDRWSWLFDLRYEDNVPSLFSFSLLMLNSLILLLIGYAESTRHNRFVLHWIGLAAVFCFLGLDEALGFHEALGEALQSRLHTSGVFYFAWTIPYIIFVLAMTVAYFNFLRALPTATRRWFVAAAAVYLGGAVGMELFESAVFESCGDFCWPHWTLATVEEILEMLGLEIFVRGLLGYMAGPKRPLRVVFETGGR